MCCISLCVSYLFKFICIECPLYDVFSFLILEPLRKFTPTLQLRNTRLEVHEEVMESVWGVRIGTQQYDSVSPLTRAITFTIIGKELYVLYEGLKTYKYMG